MYESIPITLDPCVGIADASGADSPDELIQMASVAAETAGARGQWYAEYSRETDFYSKEALALLGSLNQALKREELELYFQPKVQIATGTVIGAEALIRWTDPQRGVITPDKYIPHAEKTWLVHPLTLYALKAALVQLKRWQAQGLPLKLAVNFTATNLQNRAFLDEVVSLVRESAIDAACLEVELTERIFVTDRETVQDAIRVLKRLGITLALDDFGEGYSRIDVLQEFPVDIIKIDQKFITDLPASALSRAIVPRIIQLAAELGITTIAEGVETEEVFTMLREYGCDIAQGYFISRPLSTDDFARWLKTAPWKLPAPR